MIGAAPYAKLADSYVDHIRIAVEAGDVGAPFRDFVDNWWAFACEDDHHRSSRNRVVWFNNPDAIARRSMLLSLPFRSLDADAVLRCAMREPQKYREYRKLKDKSVRLIVDHAVPLTVVVGLLFEVGFDLSRESISGHLRRFHCLGLLTSAEDEKLNRLGLRSRMPSDWDGQDLTARYRAAGIVSADKPRSQK